MNEQHDLEADLSSCLCIIWTFSFEASLHVLQLQFLWAYILKYKIMGLIVDL